MNNTRSKPVHRPPQRAKTEPDPSPDEFGLAVHFRGSALLIPTVLAAFVAAWILLQFASK